MLERQIEISFVQQTSKAFTLKFVGDLIGSGGEVFLETLYQFKINTDGAVADAGAGNEHSIALPAPAGGTRRYRVVLPSDSFRETGRTIEREFYLAAGSGSIALSALLAAGDMPTTGSPVYQYIDDQLALIPTVTAHVLEPDPHPQYLKETEFATEKTALQTSIGGRQIADADLTTIAALDSAQAGVIASDGAGWVRKTFAQFKTSLALDNVPNIDATNPANINQSPNYRFVSDTEKTTWDGKQDNLGFAPENSVNKATDFSVATNAKYPSVLAAKNYIDDRFTNLIGTAPANLDTLQEIAAQLANDESAVSALTTTVAGKLAKASNLSDLTDFSQARSNLGVAIGSNTQAYNANLSAIAALAPANDDILQRKAGAWANRTIAQLKTDLTLAGVATSGAYGDLSGKPTLPGGAIVGTSDAQTLTNKIISGSANTLSNIPQSAVTSLTTDLAAKANLSGANFTAPISATSTSAPQIEARYTSTIKSAMQTTASGNTEFTNSGSNKNFNFDGNLTAKVPVQFIGTDSDTSILAAESGKYFVGYNAILRLPAATKGLIFHVANLIYDGGTLATVYFHNAETITSPGRGGTPFVAVTGTSYVNVQGSATFICFSDNNWGVMDISGSLDWHI